MRSKLDGPGVLLLNGFFLLTGSRASESGIDCRIFIIITVNAAFVFVATRPAIVVLGIRTTRVFGQVVTVS